MLMAEIDDNARVRLTRRVRDRSCNACCRCSRNRGGFAAPQTGGALMSVPRPYAFLAELTYRCPLHCPYCSNPARARSGEELTTNEWRRVFRETTELGVLQVGGEPLVRRDLAELVHAARETRLYTNLITSGIGLNESRADELRAAGLDSVQLSFQAADVDLADEIAGAPRASTQVVRSSVYSRSGHSTQPQFRHSSAHAMDIGQWSARL